MESFWALVVAQLDEQSLPTPEVCGSNPVIGKIYIRYLFVSVNCIEKTKIKKETGNGPFLKKDGKF